MSFDVVIVGAGIGGAVLALDLGRRGWHVTLVERESAPPRIARPEVLWGATLRALEAYGIADAIRQTASVRLEEIEIGGVQPWLRMTRDDFSKAGVDAFSTDPSLTRTIIAEAAVATGKVEIQRGVTVENLLLEDSRVTGVRARRGEETMTLEARLVVGDDGASSVVRKDLGIPIALTVFPIEFVTALITRWPLAPNHARVWINAKGSRDGLLAAAFLPWPRNEGVLLLRLLHYETMRHTVNDKSVSFSRVARRVFRAGRFLPPAIVPLIARTINVLGWPKRKVIRSFATAFVAPPQM